MLTKSITSNPVHFTTRRDAPVVCARPGCRRIVARKARQQRFCSTRCQEQAKPPRKNRNKKQAALPPYLKATAPPENANGFNPFEPPKSGSRVGSRVPRHVTETEVFGDRNWRQVVSPDGVVCEVGTLRKRALVDGGAERRS
jgi:hypothetical protein